jgi:hypothetical protein
VAGNLIKLQSAKVGDSILANGFYDRWLFSHHETMEIIKRIFVVLLMVLVALVYALGVGV